MSEFLAFTADQVCAVTGLSRGQLRYWDRTDFFVSHFAYRAGKPFGRIYSFRDLVGLRTIAIFRNEKKIPLQKLRVVGEALKAHGETPWSSLRFYLLGKEVMVGDPEGGAPFQPVSGQEGIRIAVERIATDVRQRVERLRQRRPTQLGQVEKHRHVLHNSPVVAGTRIPTAAIASLKRAGLDVRGILREYPHLTEQDVSCALAHEARHKRPRKAS
jgi:uncharacterized protein (DUF433 family)